MARKDVYGEMEAMLGLVPSFFKTLPDEFIGLEWELFKKTQMEDGAIPHKYRELIGLGIFGVSKCRYCTLYHTEMARLFGATEAEIEEAVRYAKSCSGWSTYVNGMQIDYDQFKQELLQVVEHVKSQQMKKAA